MVQFFYPPASALLQGKTLRKALLVQVNGKKDLLVSFYFEVSAFLQLVPIFVPAERGAGVSRRLALQVQLVSFQQRLTSHQPQLRSRSWTVRDRETA